MKDLKGKMIMMFFLSVSSINGVDSHLCFLKSTAGLRTLYVYSKIRPDYANTSILFLLSIKK
jgi:hypothetical protein